MNSMKRQKHMTLKDEPSRSVSVQYTTGEEQRNSSRRNEEAEPKRKQCPVVDMTGDGSKVWCCKEQYCLGTWNVRSMNQGKLDVIKQEMARVNINIWGINELKWTGMKDLIQMTLYLVLWARIPWKKWSSPHSQQESKIKYLGTISKMAEQSWYVSKANR